MKYGYLFIISGPSGVGKTSVAEELLSVSKSLKRIITCTTRKMRDGEVNGEDYFFLSENDFEKHLKQNDFVESSTVYGNMYGVLLETIMQAIQNEKNAILVINWEGYLKIKEQIKNNVFGFFIEPPELSVLELRIKKRGTDSIEIINTRMKEAENDMSQAENFDFRVINSDINETAENILNQINKILKK